MLPFAACAVGATLALLCGFYALAHWLIGRGRRWALDDAAIAFDGFAATMERQGANEAARAFAGAARVCRAGDCPISVAIRHPEWADPRVMPENAASQASEAP